MFQTGKPGRRVTTCGGRCAHLMLSRNRIFGAVMAALGAMLALSQPANGQCQYEVTAIIQAPPCHITGPPTTIAQAISNHGIVVGRYEICGTSSNEAFVWTPNPDGKGGTFKTLPRPANVTSASANGVNSAGFIIGTHTIPGAGTHGFIFDPKSEEFTYMPPAVPEATTGTVSSARGINEKNAVAGSRRISPPGQNPIIYSAVIWHPFGEDGNGEHIIVDLMSGINTHAARISSSGESVLGATGPLNNPFGTVYEAPGPPYLFDQEFDASSSTLHGIIKDGHYAGTAAFISTGLTRAFVFEKGKVTAVIDPLPGYPISATRGANVLGHVLVRSQLPDDKPGLWQNGVHIALADLMEPVENLQLTLPQAINDQGQIITNGKLGARTVGVLLTPINRPLTDLNGDCATDVVDLLLLLKSWGPCAPESCPADFTGNGSVGVPDLLYLLFQWGKRFHMKAQNFFPLWRS